MRRTISTLVLSGLVLSVAGLAAFAAPAHAGTTPPDSTVPPASPGPNGTEAGPADTGATAEIAAAAGPAVVVLDESGSELAAISVPSVEPAWAGFGEGAEPESGHEYLRLTVVVESRSPRGLFDVDYNDFILQDADGFVTQAEVVPTAEQAAAEEAPTREAELANTETVELAVTFEMVSGVAPQAVYYAPSSERLLTVLEVG